MMPTFSEEIRDALTYAIAYSYKDANQAVGENYTFPKVGDVLDGWSDYQVLVDPANPSVGREALDLQKHVWQKFEDKDYYLPEKDQVFATAIVNEDVNGKKTAVLVSRGTDELFDWDNNIIAFGLGAKGDRQLYATFTMLYELEQKLTAEGYDVVIGGHSKDGGFSSLYAAYRGLPALTVNAIGSDNVLSKIQNGLPEYEIMNVVENPDGTGGFINAGTLKLFPSIPMSKNAVFDGSNILNLVNPGDVLYKINGITPGDYIGDVEYLSDGTNTLRLKDDHSLLKYESGTLDASDLDYFLDGAIGTALWFLKGVVGFKSEATDFHSAQLVVLLEEVPELITYSQKFPDFLYTFFDSKTAFGVDRYTGEVNGRNIIMDLYKDSRNEGVFKDMLLQDLSRLEDIYDNGLTQMSPDDKADFLKVLQKAITVNFRNQMEGDAGTPEGLIKVNEYDQYYFDASTLNSDGFGNPQINPLGIYFLANGMPLGDVVNSKLPPIEDMVLHPELLEDLQNSVVGDNGVIIYQDTLSAPYYSVDPEALKAAVLYSENDVQRLRSLKSLFSLVNGGVDVGLELVKIVSDDPNAESFLIKGAGSELVFGAVTYNESGTGLAQQIWEMDTGSNGHGVVQLEMVNADLQNLMGSQLVKINYPQNFLFKETGGVIGSAVGSYLADGNVYKEVLYSTFLKSVGEEYGTYQDLLDVGNPNSLANYLTDEGVELARLEDIPEFSDRFFANLNAKLSSIIGSAITGELLENINVDGIAGEVVEVAVDAVSVEFVSETFDYVLKGLNGTVFEGFADGSFDFEIDPVKIAANYVAGRLAGEIVQPESVEAAVLGSIGAGIAGSIGASVGISAAAGSATASGGTALLYGTSLSNALAAFGNTFAPIVGAAIGVFIGKIAGTLVGNIFGSGDINPAAYTYVNYDSDQGMYVLGNSWNHDGGSKESSQSLAQSAIDGIQDIIALTNGHARYDADMSGLMIGFRGDRYDVTYKGKEKSFDNAVDAVKFAAFNLMKGFDLVGGHAVLMRAWHNSEATTLEEFKEDLEIAEAFMNYLLDPNAVITLMLNQPESDIAQTWATILQRAAELELHLPHEKDLDGGWGDSLIALGVDPEAIPSIESDKVVLTDPVTGQETILHHIWGPGYEIVRMEGTDGNDIIEVIVDGSQIAYVDGNAGDDIIIGSDNPDIIYGGDGNDTIEGRDGNDWIHGGNGNDLVNGNGGDDLIAGGQDDDELYGDEELDIIYGGDGDDYIEGRGGSDRIYGGDGNDTLYGDEGNDTVEGGDGDDLIYANGGDTIRGGKGNDVIDLYEGSGSTILIGRGDGHDVIYDSEGVNNTIRFDVTISKDELWFLQDNNDLKILILGEDQSVTFKDMFVDDNLKTSNLNIELYGGTYQMESWTQVGLNVDIQNDITPEDIGVYNVISDELLQQIPFDQGIYQEGTGINILEDYLYFSPKIKSITQDGEEVLFHSKFGRGNDRHGDSYFVKPTPNILGDESAKLRIIYGATGDDYILGNYKDNRLYGDSGEDTLLGEGGDDLLIGGLGADILLGGADDDTLYGGHENDHLYGGDGNDNLVGAHGDDYMLGQDSDDHIDGGVGDDIIKGGAGNDIIFGGLGNDVIVAGSGHDIVEGDFGIDVMLGNEGDDRLSGDEGDDTLDGGKGNDILIGGLGNDTLISGDGDDVLYGGEGDDVYVIQSTNEDNDPSAFVSLNQSGFSDGRIDLDYTQAPTDAFTIRTKFRTSDTSEYAVMSYAVSGERNDILLYRNSNGFYVYVSAGSYHTDIDIADGEWHDLHISWESATGQVNVFDHGVLVSSGYTSVGQSVLPDGELVLGQLYNSLEEGIKADREMQGDIAEFQMWDSVVDVSAFAGDAEVAGAIVDFSASDLLGGASAAGVYMVGDSQLVEFGTTPEYISGNEGTYVSLNTVSNDGRIDLDYSEDLVDSFTMRMNFRTDDTSSYALMSYAIQDDDYEIMLYRNSSAVYLYIEGKGTDTGLTIADGQWHDIHITWQASDGDLKIYDNGVLIKDTTLAPGIVLEPEGALVLGQQYNSISDGITEDRNFSGDIKSFGIWQDVLDVSSFENGQSVDGAVASFNASEMINGTVAGVTEIVGDVEWQEYDAVALSQDEFYAQVATQIGMNVIEDTDGINTFKFGDGIAVDQLTFVREVSEGFDLDVYWYGSLIAKVKDQFLHDTITNFELSDGSSFVLSDIVVEYRGTDESETIIGGDQNEVLLGYAGDDVFDDEIGSDIFQGGDGFDTVLYQSYSFAEVGLYAADDGAIFVEAADGNDRLYDVERITFADGYYEEGVFVANGSNVDVTFNASDFTSYTGSVQGSGGTVQVSNDGQEFLLEGNGWKKIALSHTITENTILEFEFMTTMRAEIHGIALEKDSDYRNSGDSLFTLYGSEVPHGLFNNDFAGQYVAEGEWQSYRIDVGNYLSGDVNYLAFVNDHDLGAQDGQSQFRNVRIYEGQTVALKDPLEAKDDAFVGDEDAVIAGNVIADNGNGVDRNVEGDALSVISGTFTTAQGGTVVVQENGDFEYTPLADFFGADNFDYTLYDGTNSAVASVALTVNEVVSEFLEFSMSDLLSYANQDATGTINIPNVHQVDLIGNTWKVMDVDYTVTSNTVLEFDFMIPDGKDGEIHALYFDNDNIVLNEDGRFFLAGSQPGTGWVQDFGTYTDGQGWQHYTINVGDYISGHQNYLVFANDDDANAVAESSFANIRIYEAEPSEPAAQVGLIVDGVAAAENLSNPAALLNGLSEITVSAWIQANQIGTDQGIFDTEPRDQYDDSLTMRYDATGWYGGGQNVIRVGLTTAEGNYYYESSENAQTTDAQQLTLTWKSGEDVKLYINGVEDTASYTSGAQGGVLQGIQDLIVSAGTFGGWAGDIFDFKVYDTALDAAAVSDLVDSWQNEIIGDSSDNTLVGTAWSDYFEGGDGADTFVFDALTSFDAVDEIGDFDVSENDVLDLSDLVTAYDSVTDAITDFIMITDDGTDSVVSVDVDGAANGQSFVDVVKLTNTTGLTDEDQLLTESRLVA